MPKKIERGDSLVSPGLVCYAEKQVKPFWFSSLDQIVLFGAIIFCRTFVELFWSVRVDRKKSHYNSRVSLHEAPTKNWVARAGWISQGSNYQKRILYGEFLLLLQLVSPQLALCSIGSIFAIRMCGKIIELRNQYKITEHDKERQSSNRFISKYNSQSSQLNRTIVKSRTCTISITDSRS